MGAETAKTKPEIGRTIAPEEIRQVLQTHYDRVSKRILELKCKMVELQENTPAGMEREREILTTRTAHNITYFEGRAIRNIALAFGIVLEKSKEPEE